MNQETRGIPVQKTINLIQIKQMQDDLLTPGNQKKMHASLWLRDVYNARFFITYLEVVRFSLL
ncbi:TPA: hypothetical protein I7703_12720 [Vibrio vulnificus]|nr:hypothetical protein D8T46_00850 [Vibrio vulnificus]HAS8342893.1 hypothetical protein [Vibrio vulnificus]